MGKIIEKLGVGQAESIKEELKKLYLCEGIYSPSSKERESLTNWQVVGFTLKKIIQLGLYVFVNRAVWPKDILKENIHEILFELYEAGRFKMSYEELKRAGMNVVALDKCTFEFYEFQEMEVVVNSYFDRICGYLEQFMDG